MVIWGAGAIGGVIGAAFIRAGQPVIFVDNVAEHVAAINQQGLKITGPMGDFTIAAQAFLPEQLVGEFDCILLAVKSHHTDAAMADIAPHLAAQGCVVSLQNGLNEHRIAEVVGVERTVGAFLNFGADFLEPGVIHHGGRGAVVIGELDGVTRLLNNLKRQGFRRILFVNGHGGNTPAQNMINEWMVNNPGITIQFHNWWNAPATWAKVTEIDPVASHASWMENFPWTRLADVEMPDTRKPMISLTELRKKDPAGVRAYLGDGNYGGYYQRADDEMLAIWHIAVDELREIIDTL